MGQDQDRDIGIDKQNDNSETETYQESKLERDRDKTESLGDFSLENETRPRLSPISDLWCSGAKVSSESYLNMELKKVIKNLFFISSNNEFSSILWIKKIWLLYNKSMT